MLVAMKALNRVPRKRSVNNNKISEITNDRRLLNVFLWWYVGF